MENPSNSTGHLQRDSLLSTVYGYTTTPVPGIINAALLLSTPLVSEQMQNPANAIERAGRFRAVNVLTRPQYLGPSKKVALLFGGANALGAWMIHDHDLESGAGVSCCVVNAVPCCRWTWIDQGSQVRQVLATGAGSRFWCKRDALHEAVHFWVWGHGIMMEKRGGRLIELC